MAKPDPRRASHGRLPSPPPAAAAPGRPPRPAPPGRRRRLFLVGAAALLVLGGAGCIAFWNREAIRIRWRFAAYVKAPGEATLEGLRGLGPDGIDFLAAKAAPPEPERKRLAALGALSALAPERSVEVARSWIPDGSPAIRRAAYERLAAGAGPDRLEEIAGGVKDADAGVRAAAIRGVARIAGLPAARAGEAAGRILPGLKDADAEARKAAADALEALGKAALDPVKERLLSELRLTDDERLAAGLGEVLDRLGVPAGERAAGVRGEERRAVELVERLKATRAVGELRALLRNGSPYARRLAAAALGDLAALEAIPDLLDAAKGGDPDLKRAVLKALLKLPDPSEAKVLEGLLKDPEWMIRREALRILILSKANPSAPAVRPLLADPEAKVRAEACRALAAFRDGEAIPALVRLLSDPEGEVRRESGIALATIGPAAGPPIVSALASEKEMPARNRYALVLEMIDQKPILDKTKDTFDDKVLDEILHGAKADSAEAKAIPEVLAALRDDDLHVRRDAARVLGQVPDPRAAEPLAVALKDVDPGVRRAAVDDLGILKLAISIPPLSAALGDRDRIVRRKALAALEALGTEGARSLVRDHLLSDDFLLVKLGEDGLAEMAWEAASAAIEEAARSGDKRLRHLALGIARRRWGEAARKLVEELAAEGREPDAEIRGEAREILGENGMVRDESPDPAADVASEDPPTRRRGAFGLLRLPRDQAAGLLRDALQVDDPYVRANACFAAKRCGFDPAAVRPVLEDRHWLARAEAAHALGALEDEASIPALLAAFEDKDAYVRRLAATGFAEFHPDRVLGVLLAALRDGSRPRREFAHRALESLLRHPFDYEPDKPPAHRAAAAKAIADWYEREKASFAEPAP